MRQTLGDRTIKDHNLFARQKRWSLLMHLFCLSNEKKHCEREIHGYFQALLVNQNSVRNQWYRSWTFRLDFASIDGSATATTRGFKFRSILPTTTLFVRKYSTFQKPTKGLHCWSCAIEKSRVWIVQVPSQRNGTFSATTVSSLVRFFPRSCRFHVQT